MKSWVIAGCLVAAFVVVPVWVEWLRHRFHRLEQGTQHFLLAGAAIQIGLMIAAGLVWWLL